MGNVDWTLAGAIILTGLTVVFIVLLFLWFAVSAMGKICGSIDASLKKAEPVQEQEAAPVAPAVNSGVNPLTPEVVAAITGAIGAVHTGNFRITSIKQTGSSTNLWEG